MCTSYSCKVAVKQVLSSSKRKAAGMSEKQAAMRARERERVASGMCETPAHCVRVEISSEFKQQKHQSNRLKRTLLRYATDSVGIVEVYCNRIYIVLWYIVDLMVRSFFKFMANWTASKLPQVSTKLCTKLCSYQTDPFA